MGAKQRRAGNFGVFLPRMEKITAKTPKIRANLVRGRKIVGAKQRRVGNFRVFLPRTEKITAKTPQIGANLARGRKIVGANATNLAPL